MRKIVIAMIILSIALSADAQTLTGVTVSTTGGGSSTGCTTSLNFSQACNSQYLGITGVS